MHKCLKCGTEYEGKFCPECGTGWQEEKTCPQCRATLNGSAKFCNECGYSFLPPKKSSVVKKWLKKHVKIIVPSAIGLTIVIVLLSLIPTFILASVNGTYYGYNNGEFLDSVYITLSTGKWESSEGTSGEYEVNGNQVTLIYRDKDMGELFGEDSELAVQKIIGTVENKVFAVKNGSGTVYYVSKNHKHKYKEEIVKEPTCTEEGQSVTSCACGLEETKEIPLTPHNVEEGICTICLNTQLNYMLNDNGKGYIVTGFNEGFISSETLKIVSTYNNIPITGIGNQAFQDCSSLTSLFISDGITSIGHMAFACCNGLTSLTIPDSVTNIERGAFYGCSSLTSITISDNVTNFGFGTFDDTAYYENENNWDNGVLYIGNHLIAAQTDILGDYQIKEGTKTIACGAFSGYRLHDIGGSMSSSGTCSGLTSITIPSSVTSIGEAAFLGCSGLTSIAIPDSVTSIGEYTFSGCSSLTSIAIPDSVTSIDEWAFAGCHSLTNITIPNGVTSIKKYTFLMCIKLNNITFNGTKEQWKAINKETGWNSETGNYTVTCTDGTLTKAESEE